MKTQMVVGVLLVVVGVAVLVFGGFGYTTTHEVVKVGPVDVTTKEQRRFLVPPAVGGVLVAGGIILLIAGGRRA